VNESRTHREHLVVGQITKVHGTKGELFVWPHTDDAEAVFAPGRALILGDEAGVVTEDMVVVERVRAFKRGLLVGFEGIGDRTEAEPLVGRYLLAPSAELAGPAEDEVYYHDLVGLAVVTLGGEAVGTVREVFETSPADLLDVEFEDGERRFIPLTKPIVVSVDVAAGQIRIDPPAGLLEL
jgi:16S rRNA processing protein RimM